MNSPLSWEELLSLRSIDRPAAYLKIMSEIWGIEVKSIVEIGVFQGKTSIEFRKFFPDALLYLIDPWKLYDDYLTQEAGPRSLIPVDYENAYQSLRKIFSQDPKVKILRKTSVEALSDVPDGVDLVFIDGNHSYSYVKQDIEVWLPKVRHGGILSGHDYNNLFPGVIQAVDEFFQQDIEIGFESTWLKRKN